MTKGLTKRTNRRNGKKQKLYSKGLELRQGYNIFVYLKVTIVLYLDLYGKVNATHGQNMKNFVQRQNIEVKLLPLSHTGKEYATELDQFWSIGHFEILDLKWVKL